MGLEVPMTNRRLLAIAAVMVVLLGACQCTLVPPMASHTEPIVRGIALATIIPVHRHLRLTGALESEKIASVVRFVTAFNAARLYDASAVFADDAALNDCDFASHVIIEARGATAIRAWLRKRFADHDRLVIARIFNMNPDPTRIQGVAVESPCERATPSPGPGHQVGSFPKGRQRSYSTFPGSGSPGSRMLREGLQSGSC